MSISSCKRLVALPALAKSPESYVGLLSEDAESFLVHSSPQCTRPSPAPNSQDSVVAHPYCRLSIRWSSEYTVKVPRQLRSRRTMPSQPRPLLAQWPVYNAVTATPSTLVPLDIRKPGQRDFSHPRLNAGVGLTPRAKDVAFDANVETSRG